MPIYMKNTLPKWVVVTFRGEGKYDPLKKRIGASIFNDY